ncbi:unnamed protein product [Symbiodinium necroappetens]|uniref:glutathione-specific gamma-glutamylcyclotransferase n=1 Tax=Symbiodinium necroappetens TaxID=1628268 RepID=A0A813BXB0_9DINO|nr:unnamed protein product [Symbiodinium necroappetens]
MRVPALPSSIPDRHGYTRTLTKLYPVKGDCDKACGEAVIYYTYNPECSAAFAGPESVEATADVIANAAGPSGPNDEYLFSLVEVQCRVKCCGSYGTVLTTREHGRP